MAEPGFVVSEYIRRFRQEKPTAEFDRQVNEKDFWWLTDTAKTSVNSNASLTAFPTGASKMPDSSFFGSDFNNISSIALAKSTLTSSAGTNSTWEDEQCESPSSQCDLILARCNELLNQYRQREHNLMDENCNKLDDLYKANNNCEVSESMRGHSVSLSCRCNSSNNCAINSKSNDQRYEYVNESVNEVSETDHSQRASSGKVGGLRASSLSNFDGESSFLYISPSSSIRSSHSSNYAMMHSDVGYEDRSEYSSKTNEISYPVRVTATTKDFRDVANIYPVDPLTYDIETVAPKDLSTNCVDRIVVEPFLTDPTVSQLWAQLQTVRLKLEVLQKRCTHTVSS